jgi:hypothetical protein
MPQPFASSPSKTTLLTPWQDPVATAAPPPPSEWQAMPGGGELQRRVAACYAQLRALPRRVRRALQRQLALPLAGVALLLALGHGLGQAATTWTVCASGCTYTSIKAAIAAPTTLNGDTLAIAAGTYTEAGISVNKSLTLRGQAASTTMVQASATLGSATDRVVTIAPGVTVTIQGLTIRYGNRAGSGGGIENNGTLTLLNSTISGNVANGLGGGLYNSNPYGILTLTNSTVSGNTATSGGGGIHNDGTLTLLNSTISGNAATNRGGGGVLNEYGTLTLLNSTISGNVANGFGGGLYNSNPLTLLNSTIIGNSATYDGGGLWNQGMLTLTNSTVSSNTATSGGGLFQNSVGTLTFTNSIVAKNPDGGDCLNSGGLITSHGYNLDSDRSCHLTAPTDQPGVDPLLGPLQNNGGPTFTQALLPGSPAIDAIPWGTNGCGTTLMSDQRWQARPQAVGGHCDIGAYEVEVAGEALGGWVTGFTPQTVVCQNVTTGHSVTLSDHATSWDCEAAGLAVTAGDHVSILARGPVNKSATDVGGAVAGMQPSSGGCTNRTTGQQVKFQQLVGATAASCVAAGLVVHAGDTVQMSVAGVAE